MQVGGTWDGSTRVFCKQQAVDVAYTYQTLSALPGLSDWTNPASQRGRMEFALPAALSECFTGVQQPLEGFCKAPHPSTQMFSTHKAQQIAVGSYRT